jgi:hypothetical protein
VPEKLASGGLSYAYEFENRLVQKGGLTIVYDGDGNRVAKTTPSATTQFLVDDLNPTGYAQVLDEVQNGSVVRDRHLRSGAGELRSRVAPILGSPVKYGVTPRFFRYQWQVDCWNVMTELDTGG